jgi:hypothetical protein
MRQDVLQVEAIYTAMYIRDVHTCNTDFILHLQPFWMILTCRLILFFFMHSCIVKLSATTWFKSLHILQLAKKWLNATLKIGQMLPSRLL